MKKYILAAALLATTASTTLFISSCSKKEEENTTEDYGTLKSKVLTDFVDVLVNPLYADFKAKAQNLNDAVVALSTPSTQENLI
jgi:putative iron-regulated protein